MFLSVKFSLSADLRPLRQCCFNLIDNMHLCSGEHSCRTSTFSSHTKWALFLLSFPLRSTGGGSNVYGEERRKGQQMKEDARRDVEGEN